MTTNCGLAKGVVGEGADPGQLQRTRIDIPSLGLQNVWADVVTAAQLRMIPGTPIVVGFVDGDVAQPVVLGALTSALDENPVGADITSS